LSNRTSKRFVVLESIENTERDRCVDFFVRPDGSFGFEEFRRDPEDGGTWTQVARYADVRYDSRDQGYAAASHRIGWLARWRR
jgi:hypothetical protein